MHTGLTARASGLQMRAFWPLKDAGVEGGVLTSLMATVHCLHCLWMHALKLMSCCQTLLHASPD